LVAIKNVTQCSARFHLRKHKSQGMHQIPDTNLPPQIHNRSLKSLPDIKPVLSTPCLILPVNSAEDV